MASRFSVEAVFRAVDRVTAPVSRMQNRVGKFTRSMSRGLHNVNRMAGKLASGLKKGVVAAGVAVFALGRAMFDVITIGADFGRAIGSAAAKFPEKIQRGTKAFKDLENAAREVGKTTEFTSTQAAQGLNFLAKAGFSADFSMRALKDIVDFATASEIEFAEAADVASDALGSFGLDSKDVDKKMNGLRRVMDVMGATANSTNVNVLELFESVTKGASISADAGAEIETFAAIMGFLAQSGIKAGRAGTAAMNITLALAGKGNKAAATFKKLGITLADENGNLRDQVDVLDDLRESLSKVTQQQRIGLIYDIFGKVPLASATKLLNESGKSVRTYREELRKADGTNRRVAAFIRNDVRGSLDAMKSAIEGVKISIFSLNKGPLKKSIDLMTDWIRSHEKAIAKKITKYIMLIVDNFKDIVKWAKHIGKSLIAFFTFITVLKTLITVMTFLNLVMLANPITLITYAVLAAVIAFTALVVWVDKAYDMFENLHPVVKLLLGPLGAIIRAIKFIKDNWSTITALPGKVGGFFEDRAGEISEDFNQLIHGSGSPQVTGPQQRATDQRTTTTNTAEVTIKDETGRAEVSGGVLGSNIKLQRTGAF